MNKRLIFAACLGVAALSAGCNDDTGKGQPSTGGGGASSSGGGSGASSPATQHAESGEHNHVPMGETSMSGLKLVATTDGPVKPGGEGAFDVAITGGKPKAVRFWVGTEDAKGSV